MRTLFVCVLIALLFAAEAFGQPETFELGSSVVKIPAPEKFTEVSERFPRVMSRLAATEQNKDIF